MSSPQFLPVDPMPVPDAVTPNQGQAVPDSYAGVTPHGTGPAPAPYDISAPQDIAGIAAAMDAAMALTGGGEGADTGAGIPNRDSPRQQEAVAILDSPQGAPSSNVFSGFPDYENQDLRPGPDMENPIQGHTADYPGTVQDLPGYLLGGGLEGVPPEGGSMAASAGGNYPGTIQDGLTKYGTS